MNAAGDMAPVVLRSRFLVAVLPAGVAFACLAGAALPPLAAGDFRVVAVKGDRVNVRAKPSFDGEVLATLPRGANVKVIAEVDGVEGEPGGGRRWAKVRLPPEVDVWVYAPAVEAQTHAVKSEVLRFRAGPGRNYSELGELKRGEVVTEVRQLEDWMQIEPPAHALAFVAKSLLEDGGTGGVEKAAEPEFVPVPQPEPVTLTSRPVTLQPAFRGNPAPLPETRRNSESQRLAEPQETVIEPVRPLVKNRVDTPAPAQVPTLPPVAPPVAVKAEPEAYVASVSERVASTAVNPKAVVREGIIRRVGEGPAPGGYELRGVRRVAGLLEREMEPVDLLIADEPKLKLERFVGRRVFVHGTEWRDERWRTPVLQVERVDTAAY